MSDQENIAPFDGSGPKGPAPFHGSGPKGPELPTPRLARTLCNRDCPDACGIVATLEGDRVLRLQGDKSHPVTRGFLCHRTNHFLRTQYHPKRVTAPLLRKAGRLEPVSWDEALDFAAERLVAIKSESGPAAIFHYRSGGTLGAVVMQASELFFERFGPVTVKRGDICSGAGEAAQELDFGVCESSHLFELERARHILLWGKNVITSSPHTIPVLERARLAGAELVLVDPVHHQTVRMCDRFVQLAPGSDASLAMGVARVLFDHGWIDAGAPSYCDHFDAFRTLALSRTLTQWCAHADVDADTAVDLARRLHDGPTAILVGWGMARRLGGGAIVRALDALGAVSGNLGIAGGGVSYYYRRKSAFRTLTRGIAAAPRTVCEPLFGPDVLAAHDPPIRAVWITAANPVAMLPDSGAVCEALRTRELVVVVDSWLSDTAELATLVLPSTTLLEADDLLGAYGHHHIGEARPVALRPPHVRSDLEILQALAARVGLGDVMAGSARDWKERLVGDGLHERGIGLESFDGGTIDNPLTERVLFEGRRFPTPTGRVQLLSELPDEPLGDPAYPLQLLSLSTPRSQSSQWAKDPPKPAEVTVHPDSANGIAHGATARIESPIGRMTVRVLHDHRQRRDVALTPKGGHHRDGACANVLVRARVTDLGEGGALYDERVRLLPMS